MFISLRKPDVLGLLAEMLEPYLTRFDDREMPPNKDASSFGIGWSRVA